MTTGLTTACPGPLHASFFWGKVSIWAQGGAGKDAGFGGSVQILCALQRVLQPSPPLFFFFFYCRADIWGLLFYSAMQLLVVRNPGKSSLSK